MADQNGPDFDSLDAGKYEDEATSVARLLRAAPEFTADDRLWIDSHATALVQRVRESGRAGIRPLERLLRAFPLGSLGGVALLELAEALLRTPDRATRSRLVAEKLAALSDASPGFAPLTRLAGSRLGAPVARAGVVLALRRVARRFVFATDIAAALRQAVRGNLTCSFDMLGEGARTEADAQRYEARYLRAIEGLAGHEAGHRASNGAGSGAGHTVSVKLSALGARFEATQPEYLRETLQPRLLRLVQLAARHGIALSVDAEECDRLIPTLELVAAVLRETPRGQRGDSTLGVVVQAYQKRALESVHRLHEFARATGLPIAVRLVKGAYWDTEIKQAQVAGRPDYPVYTTRAATDVSYLACAEALLEAGEALVPQFATHNAATLMAVLRLAAARGRVVECQRLHGMGEALYDAARQRLGDFPVRVYAPVGGHEELLPYLVRRLLENGANSSFVHALDDEAVPVAELVHDPVQRLTALAAGIGRHPRLPSPLDWQQDRAGAQGLDLTLRDERLALATAASTLRRRPLESVPDATPRDLDRVVAAARAAQPAWDGQGGEARARCLQAMADALEAQRVPLVALLAVEGGKTLSDGVAEVREAIDYLRYYAQLAKTQFAAPVELRGPVGERNTLELHGRGVFACISPWNFPLAIFTGQIAAALAAGNAVVAKPAEQTPRIAHAAVRLFAAAGLPPGILSLLSGKGSTLGQALVAHAGIAGIAFTGGTDTAQRINRTLAAREGPIIPLIAETGGLNGLFVDNTALREQVIDDVLTSAVRSAGQRCSALRLLYLPEERADEWLQGLAGALALLKVGDPADPATDVGPVIDADARRALEAHLRRLERDARIVARLAPPVDLAGEYFGPVIAEVPTPDYLETEVFGPILHVYRYRAKELPQVAARLAARGYGLTLGIHSRLAGFAADIRRFVPAGNTYVNRSMIGAIVGVQPFGGEGLSGTGPKSGGPYSLLRYAVERTVSVNTAAQGGDPHLLSAGG